MGVRYVLQLLLCGKSQSADNSPEDKEKNKRRFGINLIGLHHPLDGVTNPEYKLLHFLNKYFSLQIEEGASF